MADIFSLDRVKNGVELRNVTGVERLQHLGQPSVLRAVERHKDGVLEQLSEVVDVCAEQRRQSDVAGQGLARLRRDVGQRRVGEVEQRVGVVFLRVAAQLAVLVHGLVVSGIDARVHHARIVVEAALRIGQSRLNGVTVGAAAQLATRDLQLQ